MKPMLPALSEKTSHFLNIDLGNWHHDLFLISPDEGAQPGMKVK